MSFKKGLFLCVSFTAFILFSFSVAIVFEPLHFGANAGGVMSVAYAFEDSPCQKNPNYSKEGHPYIAGGCATGGSPGTCNVETGKCQLTDASPDETKPDLKPGSSPITSSPTGTPVPSTVAQPNT